MYTTIFFNTYFKAMQLTLKLTASYQLYITSDHHKRST